MEYTLIRSNRKTLALQMTAQGLVVRAPYGVSREEIDRFVSQHRQWVEKKGAQLAQRQQEPVDRMGEEELRALAAQALRVIPPRVAHYAPLVGVDYGRVTIRNQTTRWGSCSAQGNLNFNCLLLLAPPQVLDAVVVHELCHRKEMNHSPAFYRLVYGVYPEYDKWNGWLKENGRQLLRRMTG